MSFLNLKTFESLQNEKQGLYSVLKGPIPSLPLYTLTFAAIPLPLDSFCSGHTGLWAVPQTGQALPFVLSFLAGCFSLDAWLYASLLHPLHAFVLIPLFQPCLPWPSYFNFNFSPLLLALCVTLSGLFFSVALSVVYCVSSDWNVTSMIAASFVHPWIPSSPAREQWAGGR